MKLYRIRYRKDEWVSVVVGFAEGVNIDDGDEYSLAVKTATNGDLQRYEMLDDDCISESNVEISELGDGTPDVVIGVDGSLVSKEDYEMLKFAYFTKDPKDNPNQTIE